MDVLYDIYEICLIIAAIRVVYKCQNINFVLYIAMINLQRHIISRHYIICCTSQQAVQKSD